MEGGVGKNCIEIEEILRHPVYSVVMLAHLLLLSSTLLAICLLVHQFRRYRIFLHGNLLTLFANIVLLYAIHTSSWLFCLLRYQLLMLVYKSPCDLLTPIWMVMAIYAPYYVYSIAYPLFRFCIMAERTWATLCATNYENKKHRLGLLMVVSIWSISCAYFLYIAASALADSDSFGQAQGGIFMTSKYNAQAIFLVTIFTLFLMIFTAFCDWRLADVNKNFRDLSKKSTSYNLSRNYQLNENALALRLILPLDLSYAALYSLYIGVVLVIRAKRASLSTVQYTVYYNSTDTV